MNEKFLEDLKKSQFGNNKIYLTIIKGFIEKYINDNSRIEVLDSEIKVKASDRAGSRDIIFSINNDNLIVIVDRCIDLRRYNDYIEYDSDGVMIKRTSISSLMKKNANEQDSSILTNELEHIGTPTLYTGQIFETIDLKTIERPKNYGLDGFYSHKSISYDDRGMQSGTYIEGTFNVLDATSISNLEFPDEKNVKITKNETLDDDHIEYGYPSSRTL